MKLVDPAELTPKELYRLMITCVVPRPIAWVSTMAPDGTLNAAPFSYFQALSSSPPTVMISVGRKRGGEAKDTRANIEATGEFVVNVVSESSGERMVRTSYAYDQGTSEFAEVGLEPAPSEWVKPPRIAESAVSMECRLDRVLEIGASGICIGEVVCFHLRDDVLAPDGTVDPRKLKPLGRLGGSEYSPVRDICSITIDGGASAVDGEMLRFFHELREQSARMARAIPAEHLDRTLGEGGDTAGRILRHIAASTAWMCLHLEGRESDDEHRPWDPSWTRERLAEELEAEGARFEAAIRAHLPARRELLRRAIRHEAWHQGQIASALRDEQEPWALWRL